MRKFTGELHLPLLAKWYEMIESGEKKEEYREDTPYWRARLFWNTPRGLLPKQYRASVFRYGYTKRSMKYEYKGVRFGYGRPEWGAPTDRKVFIIGIGDKIEEQ